MVLRAETAERIVKIGRRRGFPVSEHDRKVEIGGNREEVVEIVVDPIYIDTYDLRQEHMFALAARNNKLVAAGTMDPGTGRIAVKVPGLFETVDDILNLPIKVKGDKVIRVSDVATVRKTFKDAASSSLPASSRSARLCWCA